MFYCNCYLYQKLVGSFKSCNYDNFVSNSVNNAPSFDKIAINDIPS